MKNMKKIWAMLLALTMILSLAACGSKKETPAAEEKPAAEQPAETPAEEPAADSEVAAIQSKGTLVVGITDFAPMDYKDADGNWIGFDADMAKAFAESLGVAVEFVEID